MKNVKKAIALFLAILMIAIVFAACGSNSEVGKPGREDDANYPNGNDPNGSNPNGNGNAVIYYTLPEGMSGKEAASLILAGQRLDSQLLKNSDNIFEDGVSALTSLAQKAESNLVEYTYMAPSSSSTKYESSDGSVLEINGNTYEWKNFAEFSDSYDYFLNLTNGISSSALQAAELIDNVKKYVRVVDKWVKINEEEFYLHVEENSETLYRRWGESVFVCKRIKTEEGYNRYETYDLGKDGQTRMIYVEGMLCEYSHVRLDIAFNHNFLAKKDKGYWEVIDVSLTEYDTYIVTGMVMKEDICYKSGHDPAVNGGMLYPLDIISSDRLTDLISLYSLGDRTCFSISLQGFSGYEGVVGTFAPETLAPWGDNENNPELYYEDQYYEGLVIYVPLASGKLSVELENGMSLKEGDSFFDGALEVENINLAHRSKESGAGAEAAGRYIEGYCSNISIAIKSTDFNEAWEMLEQFLELTGLECNRDMTYVESGVLRAQSELEQYFKYIEWNESPVYTNEDLDKGWENNLAKFNAMRAECEGIKDAEVLDFTNKELIELHINFAAITSQSAASVSNDGLKINVSDLVLGIEDTMLYVVGEKYTVNFALVAKGSESASGLSHIRLGDGLSAEFTGGKSFSVKQSVSFDLPALAEGEYTLVAYISTHDGIRSSGYTALEFSKITDAEETQGAKKLSVVEGEGKSLVLKCEINREIEVIIGEGNRSYADMYAELERLANAYGFVKEGAALEKLCEDGEWTVVSDGEEYLSSGTYRLGYYIANGESTTEGFVFTKYTYVESEAAPEGENN